MPEYALHGRESQTISRAMLRFCFRHPSRTLGAVASGLVLAACGGVQSSLDPAGRDAERIAQLFTVMWIGALIIWAAVVALMLLAPRARTLDSARAWRPLIVGGGVVFPIVVLTALLSYGLAEIPRTRAPGPADNVSIRVDARQWWWRVRYQQPGARPIQTANEIRLPVGRRINVRLTSEDVIHSFWVPALAGKLDMIPGRVNEMALEPTRTGTFRGACAEYCGASHARMNLVVIVLPAGEFDAWLADQAQAAAPPSNALAEQGRAAFFANGCNTCHTVRGTTAVGVAGPDLTHLASRTTIAAGQMPMTGEQVQRWIRQTELIKPGARMPAYARLTEGDLSALAAYLTGLE